MGSPRPKRASRSWLWSSSDERQSGRAGWECGLKCPACHREIESQFGRGTHHVQAIVWTVMGLVAIFWPEHALPGWRDFGAIGGAFLLLGIAQARLATLGQIGTP